MNRSPLLFSAVIAALLVSLLAPVRLAAQTETNAVVETAATEESDADTMATLRAFLQLQGQLHETQQAIERTRLQAAEAAAKHEAVMRNTDQLAQQIKDVEDRLTVQRAQDTRLTVIAVSAFAGICFLAVVATSFFQWRVVNRLAQYPAALPARSPFDAPVPVAAIGAGSDALVSSVNIETPNLRLLGAIERLEKRIQELEQAARTPLAGTTPVANGDRTNGHTHATEPNLEPQEVSDRLRELLDQAQAFLNDDKPEAAIEVVDRALQLSPENSEALVRKGAALEKLRKLNEAIECYDRAIAADSSMTIAYLYKGGLFNRMERFTEAVECYEKALRTQEKK